MTVTAELLLLGTAAERSWKRPSSTCGRGSISSATSVDHRRTGARPGGRVCQRRQLLGGSRSALWCRRTGWSSKHLSPPSALNRRPGSSNGHRHEPPTTSFADGTRNSLERPSHPSQTSPSRPYQRRQGNRPTNSAPVARIPAEDVAAQRLSERSAPSGDGWVAQEPSAPRLLPRRRASSSRASCSFPGSGPPRVSQRRYRSTDTKHRPRWRQLHLTHRARPAGLERHAIDRQGVRTWRRKSPRSYSNLSIPVYKLRKSGVLPVKGPSTKAEFRTRNRSIPMLRPEQTTACQHAGTSSTLEQPDQGTNLGSTRDPRLRRRNRQRLQRSHPRWSATLLYLVSRAMAVVTSRTGPALGADGIHVGENTFSRRRFHGHQLERRRRCHPARGQYRRPIDHGRCAGDEHEWSRARRTRPARRWRCVLRTVHRNRPR